MFGPGTGFPLYRVKLCRGLHPGALKQCFLGSSSLRRRGTPSHDKFRDPERPPEVSDCSLGESSPPQPPLDGAGFALPERVAGASVSGSSLPRAGACSLFRCSLRIFLRRRPVPLACLPFNLLHGLLGHPGRAPLRRERLSTDRSRLFPLGIAPCCGRLLTVVRRLSSAGLFFSPPCGIVIGEALGHRGLSPGRRRLPSFFGASRHCAGRVYARGGFFRRRRSRSAWPRIARAPTGGRYSPLFFFSGLNRRG